MEKRWFFTEKMCRTDKHRFPAITVIRRHINMYNLIERKLT